MGQGREAKKASAGKVDATTDSTKDGGGSPVRGTFGQTSPQEAAAWGSDLGNAVGKSVQGTPSVGVSPDAEWIVTWGGETFALSYEEYVAGKELLAEGLAEAFRIPLQGKVRECRSVHREFAGIGDDFGAWAQVAEFLGQADDLPTVDAIDRAEDEVNKFLELGYSGELYKAELQLIEAHSTLERLILDLNAYGNRVTIGSWAAISSLTLVQIAAFAFCTSAGGALIAAETGMNATVAGGIASGGSKFLEALAEGVGSESAGSKELNAEDWGPLIEEATRAGFLALIMDLGLGAFADYTLDRMVKSDRWKHLVLRDGVRGTQKKIIAWIKNMGSEVVEELYGIFLDVCAGNEPTPEEIFTSLAKALVDGAVKGFLEAEDVGELDLP